MSTFHLLSFGCRASQADGAALKRQLLEAGLEEAPSPGQSHVAVVNTCTVTAAADAEVRQIIRRLHRANPRCRILVTGCYAQRAPEEIARLGGVTWVVGNSHKHRVAEILAGEIRNPESEIRNSKLETERGTAEVASPSDLSHCDISQHDLSHRDLSTLVQIRNPDAAAGSEPARVWVGEISEEFHFAPVFSDDRTRPTLKVQDGCPARCSFCIIPDVRGASRSLEPGQVINEVRALERQGYHEIVLSGINLGSYGRDLDRRLTFLGLVERILAQTTIARLRFSSLEVMDVSADLIRLVAGERRLAQHFHVPLQSGSNRILRLMNRRYRARHYAERILAIRAALPAAAIGADVMVGFPGETDDDHTTSLRFIESLPFTYLHIFPYSRRPGTPAATMAGQMNGRVAHERSLGIRAVIAAKRQKFLEAQIGQTLPALTLEEPILDTTAGGDGHPAGPVPTALTTNYLKVALPGSGLPRNSLVNVRVGRLYEGLLYGFPEA